VCDLVESTGCFSDWARRAVQQLEAGESKEGCTESEAAPTIPQDCTAHTSVSVLCRGGYGVLEGLVVPLGTPEGTYVLEVRDDVNSSILSSNKSPCSARAPEGVEGMCAMVEPIPSFKTVKIVVVPPTAP
jgi:hypothetical protein